MSRDIYGAGADDARTRPEGLTGILDALTTVISSARAMPMSSSVLVNRAEMLDLVDQARDALPAQLGRADELLADADSARAAAQVEAEVVLARAGEQAAQLVDAEVVVAAARERAQEIVRGAQENAEGLRRDADDYCDRRLGDFEIDLGKLLSQVQAGRARLADRLGDPGQG
jgi:cell division septum initiation protein DivIVA